jgi:ATP/maltotriose-dependent transcriptional regulator MalT
VSASPIATASTLNPLAYLHTMRGEHDTAGTLLEQADEMLRELGGLRSGVSHLEAWSGLLAGQPEVVEARLRPDVDTLSSMGEGGALPTTIALLAQAVFAQGRMDEAAELCGMAEAIAAPDDTMTQPIWRGVRAKVLAREGRCDEAEALANEAVAILEPTDLLSHRGDAMLDLADVLRTCARTDDADQATIAGLALYELKGNETAAARARSLLNDRPGGE